MSLNLNPFIRLLLLAIPLLIAGEGLAQADKTGKKDFSGLKIGMNEEQVIKKVGQPVREEVFRTYVTGRPDTSYYWLYENTWTLVFANEILVKIERDRNLLLQHIQEWTNPNNTNGIHVIYDK